ncbi:MAG TPA: hypothetical protein VJ032_05425, partial [Thermoanaerobaculia bacterium]|nr:hypothetical protein [Thermoanaerobaculia bacterium]
MPKLVTARGVIAVFLFTVVLTGGCRRDETESRTAEGTAGTKAVNPPLPVPTVSPTMLADVNAPLPGVEPNLPYFDDFSWREFIALTWPASTDINKRLTGMTYSRGVPATHKNYGDVSGPLVFTTWKNDYELFLPNGDGPAPWDTFSSPSPCGGSLQPYQIVLGSFNKYHGFNEASFGFDTGP